MTLMVLIQAIDIGIILNKGRKKKHMVIRSSRRRTQHRHLSEGGALVAVADALAVLHLDHGFAF